MSFRIPLTLRKRIIAVSSGGAISIAAALLGGHTGLEGQANIPYYDPVGVLTVCSGVTGADVVPTRRYTDSECDFLLTKHLNTIANEVDGFIRIPIPITTRAALYSFSYNVGINNFKTSTLLRLLNMGERKKACDQLSRWVYAKGKKFNGLVVRRKIERDLCLSDSVLSL